MAMTDRTPETPLIFKNIELIPGTALEDVIRLKAYRQLESTNAELREALRWVSEAIRSVLCDPEDKMCFIGSDGDHEVMQTALAKIDAALKERPNE
jgi:hypothetical protein